MGRSVTRSGSAIPRQSCRRIPESLRNTCLPSNKKPCCYQQGFSYLTVPIPTSWAAAAVASFYQTILLPVVLRLVSDSAARVAPQVRAVRVSRAEPDHPSAPATLPEFLRLHLRDC